MRTLKFVIVCVVALLVCSPVNAKPLRIIFTNDIHSDVDKDVGKGIPGLAAVAGTINRLKQDAEARNIETFVVDGGDFTEGSQFFLADRGRAIWRLMDQMGYEAVTLGNHDYLMGLSELNTLLGDVRPKFPILAANVYYGSKFKHVKRHFKPWIEIQKAGVKIAILGLTIDDIFHMWRLEDGVFESPIKEAQADVPYLKKRNDYVFALSHLGWKVDRNLVSKVSGLDLIIGGHSHSALREVFLPLDAKGKAVPIVQAGSHTEYVGDLIVDLAAGKPLQVLSYELVPVDLDGPEDPIIKNAVNELRENMEQEYGKSWLYEVVGYSEVPLKYQKDDPTTWSKFVVEAMRNAAGADVAMDMPAFTGRALGAGPLNREQLFSLYPKIFSLDNRYGWTVWQTKVDGWLLKLALQIVLKKNIAFGLAGVTYKTEMVGNKRKISDIRIGGKKIKPFKKYRVAMPEGIGRGIVEMDLGGLLRLALWGSKDTRIPIWFAVEKQLQKVGGVIKE